MAIRPTSLPAEEPVSVSEAKLHLRVEHTEEDAYIGALITAARTYIEKQTQKALATQEYLLTLDSFPTNDDIRLDTGPVLSISSVSYYDEAGLEQFLDPADYFLDNMNEPGWLIPAAAGWPTPMDAANAVRVSYLAGWDNGMLPGDLRAGILLLVGHWYQNREAVTEATMSEPPHAVHRIVHNHRVFI